MKPGIAKGYAGAGLRGDRGDSTSRRSYNRFSMRARLLLALAICPALAAQPPSTVTVRVPGTANPYLAGMPNGARSSFGDSAPRQAPILVPVSLSGAVAVTFSVSGATAHVPGCPPGCDPPDGGGLTRHQDGAENGISQIAAPFDSLIGLFLGDAPPDKSRAPRAMDFERIGRNFVSLAPELKQIFFIGAGVNKNGTVRRFLVPKGATRLFLANMDGFEWINNSGSFVVKVIVERTDVSSSMFNVDSTISYAKWDCLPVRRWCTPGREIVESSGPGQYHVVLPAQIEWGASVPITPGATVAVGAVTGAVCLDSQSQGAGACYGSQGSGSRAGPGYLKPDEAVGALVMRNDGDRAYFSVNGRAGAFQSYEGYFDFTVTVH